MDASVMRSTHKGRKLCRSRPARSLPNLRTSVCPGCCFADKTRPFVDLRMTRRACARGEFRSGIVVEFCNHENGLTFRNSSFLRFTSCAIDISETEITSSVLHCVSLSKTVELRISRKKRKKHDTLCLYALEFAGFHV